MELNVNKTALTFYTTLETAIAIQADWVKGNIDNERAKVELMKVLLNDNLGETMDSVINKTVSADSSNVVSTSYSNLTMTLVVVYKGGSAYRYENVPQVTWEALENAESVGKFLHANIKDNYVCSKLN